mmetsp:Transcript_6464/g.24305  ORF Transcript_6464/g.24305 Transcript_6464/m.24305 type:complete len:106 (-) Transcript_6464:140-457(-)
MYGRWPQQWRSNCDAQQGSRGHQRQHTHNQSAWFLKRGETKSRDTYERTTGARTEADDFETDRALKAECFQVRDGILDSLMSKKKAMCQLAVTRLATNISFQAGS